jgi:hypothetical protein
MANISGGGRMATCVMMVAQWLFFCVIRKTNGDAPRCCR